MSLMNILTEALGNQGVRQISRQLGADEATTGRAISAALPMLVGALSRNAKQGEGASALAGALDRDHDGSILDDLAGFVSKGQAGDGDGILGHVLGGRRGGLEAGISQMSGLDAGSTGKLMAMLAPVLMGALGREKRQRGLDQSGLADLLGQENERAERAAPGSMGMVGKLLDADGDGDIMDDVAKMGAGLLGNLFSGRR